MEGLRRAGAFLGAAERVGGLPVEQRSPNAIESIPPLEGHVVEQTQLWPRLLMALQNAPMPVRRGVRVHRGLLDAVHSGLIRL